MKNTIKVFGLIALVALIGFSMPACSSGGGDDSSSSSSSSNSSSGSGGTFTLTDIPAQYNGMKVIFSGQKNFSNDLSGRGTVISNGRANIPVLDGVVLRPYSDSVTITKLRFDINDSSETTVLYGRYTNNVAFSKGSATLSYNVITWSTSWY